MNRRWTRVALAALVAAMTLAWPAAARADDWYGARGEYFTVQDENGAILFSIGYTVSVGDEYISGNNDQYTVVQVDESARRAIARYTGTLEPLQLVQQLGAFAANTPKIAIYCTHSAESYEPTDGTDSKPEEGGIFDVASALKDALEEQGAQVEQSEDPHEPHDAGAYRRSRKTAVQMMESIQPDMIIDVHRDAVPEEEYAAELNGDEISQVRLVVGRSNQNQSANKEFARKLKQVADQEHPGLIKDIFIGKGSYNQDLMPQAILMEFGTHTISKDKVINSTSYMAEVIMQALGAGARSPQASPGANGDDDEGGAPSTQAPGAAQPAKDGAGRSLLWIVLAVAVVAVLVILLTVRKGQHGAKIGGFFKELTGIGKKGGRDDPRNKM